MSVSSDAGGAERFLEIYGVLPEWEASAPGRVNLIGEHVDYCDGFVLPMAIERRVTLFARRVPGRMVTLHSDGMLPATIDLGAGPLAPAAPAWSNYPRGVMAGFQKRGLALPGLEIFISSTVPVGGGLSSSAALEVATATLLEAITGCQLGLRDKALLCQRAEHEFAGVPCGIMDQFASVFAKEGYALFIDCRSQEVDLVPFAGEDAICLIVDTRVKHELVGNEYAQRRAECEEACRRLGAKSFRDLTETALEQATNLPVPLRRRARHVLTEIERVPAFVACLRRRAWLEAGSLMYASHHSLRNDFEVSCAELDFVVDQAASLSGVFGCRMTGGGFGGCCVALVAKDKVADIQQALAYAYYKRFDIQPTLYVTPAAAGPSVHHLA